MPPVASQTGFVGNGLPYWSNPLAVNRTGSSAVVNASSGVTTTLASRGGPEKLARAKYASFSPLRRSAQPMLTDPLCATRAL